MKGAIAFEDSSAKETVIKAFFMNSGIVSLVHTDPKERIKDGDWLSVDSDKIAKKGLKLFHDECKR